MVSDQKLLVKQMAATPFYRVGWPVSRPPHSSVSSSGGEFRQIAEIHDLAVLHLVKEGGLHREVVARVELDRLGQALVVDLPESGDNRRATRVAAEPLEHRDDGVGDVVRLGRVGTRGTAVGL